MLTVTANPSWNGEQHGKMNTKAWIAAVTVAVSFASLGFKANATLIDLGERDLPTRLNGVDQAQAFIEADQGLPAGTLTFLNAFDADTNTFFNGGAVDSSHFDVSIIDGGVNGEVSWDLGTTGFQLSYVFLKDGRGSRTGPYLYHLYGVTPDEVFNSNGQQFITINGIRFITYISFFGVPGSPTVPEGGVTLILLALGLIAIELVRRFQFRRAETVRA